MKQLFPLLLGLVFAAGAASQNTAVHFAWGVEQLPANFETLRAAKPEAEASEAGSTLRYIQFEHTLDARQKQALTETGVRLMGYVYPATYLVITPDNLDYNRIVPLSPRSVVPVKPEWKMARSLREPPYGAWAVHGEWIDVNLQVCPDISIPEGAARCADQGMIVLQEGNQNGILMVRMLQTELNRIAALPFIQYLELAPPPGEKEDTRGRSLHRSNAVDTDQQMGRKYNGSGVSTLVRDDGQLGPHIDFQGRLINLSNTPPLLGTHGDGVGGIMAGAGNLDPTKKGMAAGATVYTVDYVNSFQDETLPLHIERGVTITNSSYSDNCNAGYTLATQTVDSQLFTYPTLMHVFSAGNSNGQDCDYGAGNQWGNITGGHKMAKNAIAAANLLPDATLDETSSRGPAYDGRLKPDISANGTNHFSTNPFNDYQEFGGTSGAAPGVAGCMAQLTQAYRGITGQNPEAALLKGMLLNTANDLGNPGPDFKFGWGHLNALRAVRLLEQHQYLDGQLDQGGNAAHIVTIPSGVKQAKLMVIWSEPKAIPGAAKALVNDLDLNVLRVASGKNYLPWKLDPTPDPDILDLPAGKGRDSLNNVEQVSIDNPEAGEYTVIIKAFDIPFGPQKYYLLWEFLGDEVEMTYPLGGEGFVPGEVERLRWDAYGDTDNFQLSYSTDNGASFSPLTTVAGEKRMYDWTVPNMVNGKVKLRIQRGTSIDTTDQPFTIAPVPGNIKVERVCPDSMTVSWNEVSDTLSYDVYLLGSKYMEIKGRFNEPTGKIALVNAGLPQWISVRTAHADGTAGLRAVAVNWTGGLFNCPQATDMAVRKLLFPIENVSYACSSVPRKISVRIKNEGQQPISGAQLNYQVNNDAPVGEPAPDLMPGDSIDFMFQTPFSISGSGTARVKVWQESAGDVAYFNDTLTFDIQIINDIANGTVHENFQTHTGLPPGWAVVNPDNWYTWSPTNQYPNLIGIDGEPTRAFFVNHYDYEEYEGAMDYLYMIPADLSALNHPILHFDVAHRNYSSSTEKLRVEMLPACDLDADAVVLLELADPDLSTAGAGASFFIPGNFNQWKRHTIDLSAYAGQTAVFRFVSVNAFGNNTYLDNINIDEYVEPVPAVAEMVNPPDTTCRQDTVQYLANLLTPSTAYVWSFGAGAFPSSATGAGPHLVTYLTAGVKTVRLIASNPYGADTAFQSVLVRQFPIANFTHSTSDLTVSFNNGSTNATSYYWDFGDGTNSEQANPVHTFPASGNYPVRLDAINDCKTVSKNLLVSVTSSAVVELPGLKDVSVSPNPTAGDFVLRMVGQSPAPVQLNLYDSRGQLIHTREYTMRVGENTVSYRGLQLPKGLYRLRLQTADGAVTLSVVVQ